jgi:hypothetical protein
VAARVGKCKTEMVLDSGSEVNLITEDCAKRTGLLILQHDTNRIKLAGVGGMVECIGVIPGAIINITERDLPTIGDLLVIEKGTIPLLGGRPWDKNNMAGTSEKKEGTFLDFESQDDKWSINISPNESFMKQYQGDRASILQVQRAGAADRRDYRITELS